MKAELRKEPLDQVAADLYLLPISAEGGPLPGSLGLLDWRMEGRLSRLRRKGDFTGAPGQRTLVLNVQKAGAPAAWLEGAGLGSADARESLLESLRAALRAGARRVALAADPLVGPGRAFESPESLRAFLDAAGSNGLPEHVILGFFDEVLI